ncbi:MAG: flippase-like domain-containing protein [Muribaculaceae bacterium]|nr:flippase-like domain-containing protein [Muribaculaceae bacterium]
MKKVISALLKYGIPIAISVGLAWFLSKNVNWGAINDSLRNDVNYWWFLPVIVVSVLSHIFRALRWRLQLRAIDVHPSTSALVNSIFGTYFVNLLFPRLGEVWRSGYIANREKASFTQVLGSMVGDRLSDTVTVALLTLFTFFIAQDKFVKFFDQRGDDGSGSMFTSWVFWLLVALGVLGVLTLVWIFRSKSENKIIAKLRLMLRNLWDGLAAIGKMDGKWMFLLYTVLIWGCYFLQLYLASFAFSCTKDLGIVAILVLFVLSSIGMAVPSNGGLGPWQFAIIFGLTLYGVGAFPPSTPYDPQASAFAWLVWGVQTCLLIVLGIYAFISMAIDRKRIAQGKTVIKTQSQSMKL